MNSFTQWLIKWKRPEDDSWLYHIPKPKFNNEIELSNHLIKHTDTKDVEFLIVGRVGENGILITEHKK